MLLTKKIIYKIDWYYNLYAKRKPNYITYNKWIKDDGPNTLRFNYPLSKESIVIDAGGYRGDWSAKIAELYDPHIFIFEPIPEYFEIIKRRFDANPKIKVFNNGIFSKTVRTHFGINGEGSGMFMNNKNKSVEVSLIDIGQFISENKINRIDLIKINIEGGEYELLNKMISSGIVNICNNIQIQFHHWVPNAIELREEIINLLQITHYPTYQYPFTFENWRRKDL